MSLMKPIARNLDDPPRLLGMSPFELCACVVSYAVLNTVLKGVPFSGLLALGAALGAALFLRIANLTRPPEHAAHLAMSLLRPKTTPVLPLGCTEDGGKIVYN
jgi:hypothetical protein